MLNLLERAAARPGRWPDLLLCLFHKLYPERTGASSSSAFVDLLGGDGSPERPKAECVTAWHSSPDLMGSFSTGFHRQSGQRDHSDIASAATVSVSVIQIHLFRLLAEYGIAADCHPTGDSSCGESSHSAEHRQNRWTVRAGLDILRGALGCPSGCIATHMCCIRYQSYEFRDRN